MNTFILEALLKIVGKNRNEISGSIEIQTRNGFLYLVPCETIKWVRQVSGEDYICFSWENINKGLTAVALNIKDVSTVRCEFKK